MDNKTALEIINKAIKRLTELNQNLKAEHEKSVLDQLLKSPKGTWVVFGNTYYQIYEAYTGLTTGVELIRLGVRTLVELEYFKTYFKVATPEQITQHLDYLKRTGGVYEPMAGSTNGTSFDPLKCDFYMVTCRGIRGAKTRHKTYEEAEKEAIQIAEHENHETWIVGVVASVKPKQKITHEVQKRF